MQTLPRKSCTLLGYNPKGRAVFLGKKETDNPEARDLTLWYTIGIPRLDGGNYRRVPAESEAAYVTGKYDSMEAWIAHLRVALNLH